MATKDPQVIADELMKACRDTANAAASTELANQDATLTGDEPDALALGIEAGIASTLLELHRRGLLDNARLED